jgi:hypothetical protein
MKRTGIILLVAVFLGSEASTCLARSSSVDIIRSGLLGAGAGAIGGAASGADSNDLWIGALTGAGVNIIGGSLLDLMAEGNTGGTVQRPINAYSMNVVPVRRSYSSRPKQRILSQRHSYGPENEEAYLAGYKAGYVEGYKDGLDTR